VLLALGLLIGCGGRAAPPPEAGFDRGGVPDLRGQRVLVLPPQIVSGGHRDLEREMAFALTSRSQAVRWVTPDQLRARMDRTPGFGVDPDRLPVEPFLMGELDRIGDPLFGDLYRLAALEDAQLALLPIEVRERPDGEGRRVVEVMAALIHARSGRVLWFGVVEGASGAAGDLAATASAVDALARRLVR
jgi:hypothetical protein